MNTKITNRDRFSEIAVLMEAAGKEELASFCYAQIDSLEQKAQKAKERAEKTKAEGDPLRDEVYEILDTETFQSIADIVATIGREDVTNAKVTARLTKLGKEGVSEKQEISIATADGKTRKVNGYRRIAQ